MMAFRTPARRFALAGTITLVSLSLPVAAVLADLGAVFELDGDAVSDPAAGDDWDVVNTTGGTALARTGTVADPAPVSIFTGGGSKDGIDISSWKHRDGSVPDKDNITNAYAAAYNVDGDLVITFGADRFANDGDAQLGFWFFQQNVTLNTDGRFDGTHEVGDVLVLANFSQGGSVSTIQVLEWVGSGGNQGGGTLQLLLTSNAAQCAPGFTGTVCAITNPGPVAAPWPYTPKQGSPGTFPPVSFFEGAINITEVFAGSTAPCFASFLAETRSSTSVSAVLKDFVLGAFPVCGVSITANCPSSTVNQTETGFVYTFGGTVTNTGVGTIFDVTVVDDAGTPGNPADDITIPLGTLAGGASANFSGTFESTLNPATHSATVSAATSSGGPQTVTDTSDPSTCPPVSLTPHISVTKACEVRLVVLDGRVVVQVVYSGQVCAGDQVGLDNVTVRDDSGTPGNTADDRLFTIGGLNKNQCAPYAGSYLPASTFSSSPGSASFTDTVTAAGDARLGFGHVEATRSATCPVCP